MADDRSAARRRPDATAPDAPPAPAPGALRLFNTLTRRVEEVVPIEPGRVRLYSCGPTVYRFVHIGNLRSFTMADWIRRTLAYHGLDVLHVKNITDVGHMRQDRVDRGEDKLIAQALREGKSPWEIARFYTDAFLRDEERLNILPAHVFPRATDHIPEMIALARRLLERGVAYEAGGNVFFSVVAFPAYGQLSGNLLEHLGQGQVTENEMTALKRAPEDFPLWKAAEPGRLMAWDSPWGRGFPGWHIECSAMSMKYLGEQLDLHTGGIDNLFPHHEDERAQSEAATGRPFVRCWVHGQHLLADGLKMAKSAGNAYTLGDLQARGFEPLALRYFFTTALYRTRINFTFRALRASQTALARLRRHARALAEAAGGRRAPADAVAADPVRGAFAAALDSDLNLPAAMAVVWAMLRDPARDPALRLALLLDLDRVLGFDLAAHVGEHVRRAASRAAPAAHPILPEPGLAVPEPVLALARARAARRAVGDYSAADALRREIAAAGIAARDTRSGTVLAARPDDEPTISGSRDVPSLLEEPDRLAFSVALLAANSRDDLARCVAAVARHAAARAAVEVVIVDNGSTDDTLAYLRDIARAGEAGSLPARVLFADHNMGFAAGRNAALRASLGRIVVLLDTSIELAGDIWTPIERALADPTVGVVGPYGLVTDDLREFRESPGPDVDAVEGYLMAFRRAALLEVGPAEERFRFYRLMDVDYCFEFKRAGLRVVADPALAARVIRHPHREWHGLTADEQAEKSKRNYDVFRRRRHHAESLLVRNYRPGQAAPWGHDHAVAPPRAPEPRFEHPPLGDAGAHIHEHKHWPDHAHCHAHVHEPAPPWPGHDTRPG